MLHGIYMQQPEGQSPEAVKYYGTLGLEVLIAYTLYGKNWMDPLSSGRQHTLKHDFMGNKHLMKTTDFQPINVTNNKI